MAEVALVVHHERLNAAGAARDAVAWLEARSHRVRLPKPDAEVVGRLDLEVDDEALADGARLAISVGGDGTMLRTVDLVSQHGIPVLGINCGQLGYLAHVEPEDLPDALERFFAGDFEVDHRMLLSVRVDDGSGPGGGPVVHHALNEAVLEKTPMGHTVRLEVSIDGNFFTTYAADGLIVATPTGSTAYAFSARGPIVAPEHRAILLTPVSPHMLFDRTLVLEPRASVRIRVCGHRPATLSVDGRNLGDLVEDDAVVSTASDHMARLVTFGGRDFHRILKAKFGLNDR